MFQIKRTTAHRKTSGFALLLVLLAILIFTGMAAAYFKSSLRFEADTEAESLRRIMIARARSGVDSVRTQVLQLFQNNLPTGTGQSLVFSSTSSTAVANRNSDLLVNSIAIANMNVPPPSESYDVSCYQEGRPPAISSHCTTSNTTWPKFLKITYRAFDIGRGVLVVDKETLEVTPATLNQFAYLVLAADPTIPTIFDGVVFTGNMGIFFDFTKGGSASTTHMRFTGNSPTVFTGLLVTNLTSQSNLTVDSGSPNPDFQKGVAFNHAGLQASTNQTFGGLSAAVTTAKLPPSTTAVNGSPFIVNGVNIGTINVDTSLGAAKACEPSCATYTSQIYLGSTTAGANADPTAPCSLKIAETANWDDGTKTTVTGTVNTTVTNRAFYIRGSARTVGYLHGDGTTNSVHSSTVCQNNTFMAQKDITIGSSILKANAYNNDVSANIALMPGQNVNVDSSTYLKTGLTIAATKTAAASLFGGDDLHNPYSSLQIYAAVVPNFTDPYSGNFNIDSTIYNGTASASAVALGELDINGMLVSNNFANSKTVFAVNAANKNCLAVDTVDGFCKVNIITNPQLVVASPPGIGFNTNLGYVATVTSESYSDTSLSEAIAAMH